jgi:hypothetical protein
MKLVIIATTLSLALAGTTLWAAAGQATNGTDPKIGTRVTITGCLHESTRNSFVLLGVTERPADSEAQLQLVPYAIYWLDSTDGLKPFVGEIVDITGKVTERRGKPGTITVSIDPSDALSTDVQVKSGGGSIDATTEKFDGGPRSTGASTSSSTLEMTRPVYKLAVANVRAVSIPVAGPACR